MERMEHSELIAKAVPVVYNQWMQFEEFPRFMHGVKSVRQIDATHQQWCAVIGGKEVAWTSEIIEQVPDKRIVWRSTSGARHGGRVEFRADGPDRTLLKLAMEYEPDGLVENIGDSLGITGERVKADLERFKEFMESMGPESEAWRGEIPGERESTRDLTERR